MAGVVGLIEACIAHFAHSLTRPSMPAAGLKMEREEVRDVEMLATGMSG